MVDPADDKPLDPPLEGALREAFGDDTLPEPGERSIMARLAKTGGVSSRVLLHDDPDEVTPILRVWRGASGAHDASGERYHLVGEIATGGVGVVYKARDRDLGRDVALKVLREDRVGHEEIFERFFEEAQIGAQLQHPGIVPVYGLGLQKDGRPFFAMKLVKGRTLAAVLKGRGEPLRGGRKLLSNFEQVCQTVAYAHARGVIHRDLKPANVMLGAFGEVLVVDWGFGKVLGRADRTAGRVRERHEQTLIATVRSQAEGSHSIVGSVMGTPAYMPPEQAMGQVEELDQRSDVFGLGAILCQILTGAPPYTGEGGELLQQALQARLDGAHERLDASGAPAELVALCKRCLAPLRSERPDDASVLAQEVGGFLAAAEERAHAVELDAVAQQAAREREEADAAWARRARTKTRALACAVVAAVLLAGGLWWWQDAQARSRTDAVRPGIEAALADALALSGAKRHGEALAQAERARDLAVARGGDAALRTRADDLVVRLRTASETAAAEAARRAADEAFLADLRRIRLERSGDRDARRTDAAFRSAFAARAADVDEAPPAIVATKLLADHGRIAVQIAAALDTWAWMRRTKPELAEADADRVADVALRIDPDPVRTAIRQECARGDLEAMRAHAASAGLRGLPPETRDVLGLSLASAGAPEEALEVLRALHRDHPGDFWGCSHVVYLLEQLGRIVEATPYATAAVALAPGSAIESASLAEALEAEGRTQLATRTWRRALALDPADATLRVVWAERLLQRAQPAHAGAQVRESARPGLEEAEGLLRAVLAGPDEGLRDQAQKNLVGVLFWLGRPDEALAACDAALYGDPGQAHLARGWVLSSLGRAAEALAAYDQALATADEWTQVTVQVNRGGVLTQMGRLAEARAAYERALELAPRRDRAVNAHLGLGVVLMNLGQPEAAVAPLRRAIEIDPRNVLAHSNLGWALQLAGKGEEGLVVLRRAVELAPGVAAARVNLSAALVDRAPAEALEQARAAVKLEPSLALAHGALGVAYYALGRLDEAIAAYREATRLNPKAAVAWNNLGAIHARKGDQEGALDAYRRAAGLAPHEIVLHRNLIGTLKLLGRWREAHEYGRKVAALHPRLPEGWGRPIAAWLAEVMPVLERQAAAEEAAAAVLAGEAEPADTRQRAEIAELALIRGDPARALALYERAFADDPGLRAPTHPQHHWVMHALAALQLGSASQAGGDVLPDEERARLRKLARTRVVEALAVLRGLEDQTLAVRWLHSLCEDSRFDFYRDETSRSALPQAERAVWAAFWADMWADMHAVHVAREESGR